MVVQGLVCLLEVISVPGVDSGPFTIKSEVVPLARSSRLVGSDRNYSRLTGKQEVIPNQKARCGKSRPLCPPACVFAYTEKCPSPARNALEEVGRISTGKSVFTVGCEQQSRGQPSNRCVVYNNFAPRPCHELDEHHHCEPARDDYAEYAPAEAQTFLGIAEQ
jgi:hypothetical protein